jgi:hypothetical protein
MIASSGDLACRRSIALFSIYTLRGLYLYSTTVGHLNQ